MAISQLYSTYTIVGQLGEGSFGKVYKAIHKKTGQVVAIKTLKRRSGLTSTQECVDTVSEIKILKVMDHDNIIHLRSVILESGYLHMVFDFMESNLRQVIENRRKEKGVAFPESEIRCYLSQMLKGLDHMHAQGYMHRDLKPENVLATSNQLKISDFGSAAKITTNAQYKDYAGTRWYRAPEICVGEVKYDEAVDMWALGAIMAEMYILQPLFRGENKDTQFAKITRIMGSPSQKDWDLGYREAVTRGLLSPGINLARNIPTASKPAIDLMYKLLSWDPKKRITAKEALKHPFFKDCNKPQPISATRSPPGFPAYPQTNAAPVCPPGFPASSYAKAVAPPRFPAYPQANVAPVGPSDFPPLPCGKAVAPPRFQAISNRKFAA